MPVCVSDLLHSLARIDGDFFFLFIGVFPLDFSLSPTSFLKTPKAQVIMQRIHVSLLTLVCPRKSLAKEKALVLSLMGTFNISGKLDETC